MGNLTNVLSTFLLLSCCLSLSLAAQALTSEFLDNLMDLPWRSSSQLVPIFLGGINGFQGYDSGFRPLDLNTFKGYMFTQLQQLEELQWVYAGFKNEAFYGYGKVHGDKVSYAVKEPEGTTLDYYHTDGRTSEQQVRGGAAAPQGS